MTLGAPKISTTFEPSIKSTRFVHESFDESLPMNGFLPGFADPVESRLLLGTSVMHADISKLLAPELFLDPARPGVSARFTGRGRSVGMMIMEFCTLISELFQSYIKRVFNPYLDAGGIV